MKQTIVGSFALDGEGLRKRSMGVSVRGCLNENMVSRRKRKRVKWRLGQVQGSAKPDTKQIIAQSCA